MKRILSIYLLLALLLSGLAVQTFAAEGDTGNTYNAETIPFSDWANVGEGSWTEEDGVITADGSAEWLLLQYDRKLTGNYIIEFDVKQPDMNQNLQIIMGFEVNQGENYTTSGLTFELHNAGVGRLYDTSINRQNQLGYGGCNNTYGGHQTYSPTTEWIHVKIQRVENLFTVEYNDGTLYRIQANLDNYNGGYLVLGAQNARKVSYKNITIQDNLDVEIEIDEPIYPEEIGDLTYTFNGNKYGEWVADGDTWSADGAYYTQTSTDAGKKATSLNVEKMRNFTLNVDYEVLSEGEGSFGIGFRTSTPYEETLGYGLIFKCAADGNKMSVIDYLWADTSLDGLSHEFELAGSIRLSCSGNETCVWLDDTLIANIKNNGYSSGAIMLFTDGCSVEFSNLEIVSDDLLSDDSASIIETAEKLAEEDAQGAAAALQSYEGLDDFQKSIFPDAVKTKLETMAQASNSAGNEQPQNDLTVVWIAVAVAVVAAVAVGVVLIIRKKKSKKG